MKEYNDIAVTDNINIHNMIYNFRGKQVMIDRDLASLYNVETKVLNQAVKRNLSRFPENFRFQLTNDERDELVTNCDRFSVLKHSTSNPYVFTEQGIAMLSAVLKSDIAIEVSIKIMNSFVEMRKILLSNQELLSRLQRIETKQIETDKKFEEVFNYMSNNTEVKQNIFFDCQIYDAYSFIVGLIEKANDNIILIDNYVDIITLNILSKKRQDVQVSVVTSGRGRLSDTDIKKFNAQYHNLKVKKNTNFHDRFLILDKSEVYLIGASIKDAGKKCFGIAKIEDQSIIADLINKVDVSFV